MEMQACREEEDMVVLRGEEREMAAESISLI